MMTAVPYLLATSAALTCAAAGYLAATQRAAQALAGARGAQTRAEEGASRLRARVEALTDEVVALAQRPKAPAEEEASARRERLRALPARFRLGELGALLDAIADAGALRYVVLADEAGLPIAASSGARDVEAIAATAALVLLQLERSAREGSRPVATVVLDEERAETIHRVFRVDGGRYVLTALAHGGASPEDLDGALGAVAAALGRP